MSDIQGKCEDGAFRVEVLADSSGKWAGNGLRFDTAENAEAYARDLSGRWMAVREWRVVELIGDPTHVETANTTREVKRGN